MFNEPSIRSIFKDLFYVISNYLRQLICDIFLKSDLFPMWGEIKSVTICGKMSQATFKMQKRKNQVRQFLGWLSFTLVPVKPPSQDSGHHKLTRTMKANPSSQFSKKMRIVINLQNRLESIWCSQINPPLMIVYTVYPKSNSESRVNQLQFIFGLAHQRKREL